MKKIISLLGIAFAVASVATASVDLKESKFNWKATKKIGKFHTGEIFLKSANAEIKKDKIVKGEFVMDMSSFTDTDLEGEWHQKFMDHVKSPDFFDVQKYPTATLVIDSMPTGSSVAGTLTIKDKTEPVTVNFTKKGNEYTGTLVVDRTKFGITYGSENFFKNLVADKIINNDFEITFKVVVKEEAAEKPAKKAKK